MKQGIFIICLFALLSCTKDRHKAYINGQVVDATTGGGLVGATVYIQKKSTSCFGCGASTFATITADSKGYFVYSYTPEKNTSYYVVASANKYFGNASIGGVPLGSACGTQNISIKLQPYAWLKLHIKNTIPYNFSDEFDYGGTGYASFGESFYGSNVDTVTNLILTVGNATQVIYGRVIKNSITTNYTYTVYCQEFDTTLYNINY